MTRFVLHRRVAALDRRQLVEQLARQGILQFLVDLGELPAAGLDLVATDQMDPEGRFDRPAHLAHLQRERRPRK